MVGMVVPMVSRCCQQMVLGGSVTEYTKREESFINSNFQRLNSSVLKVTHSRHIWPSYGRIFDNILFL